MLVRNILCQQHPGAHLGSGIAPLSTQCQCNYKCLEQSRHHHFGKGSYTLQVTSRAPLPGRSIAFFDGFSAAINRGCHVKERLGRALEVLFSDHARNPGSVKAESLCITAGRAANLPAGNPTESLIVRTQPCISWANTNSSLKQSEAQVILTMT
jgi:hypothetical protein